MVKRTEKVIKKTHYGRYGYVSLIQGEKYFSVQTVLYNNKDFTTCTRGRLNAAMASDFFNSCVKFIQRKQPWSEPRTKCSFNADKIQTCCATNCPKSMGGAAFWEIFGITCHHRTR